MARVLAFIVGAVAGWVAMTADAESPAAPDSLGCRQALDALQAQESAALSAARSAPPSASAPGAAAATLRPWRERAARACLGGNGSSPAPARTAQPPLTVPPVTAGRPLIVPVAPPVPATSLPARSDPLLTVVACDPAGCWASDGSRLNRVGPNLVGPRGTCTLQGAVLRCP